MVGRGCLAEKSPISKSPNVKLSKKKLDKGSDLKPMKDGNINLGHHQSGHWDENQHRQELSSLGRNVWFNRVIQIGNEMEIPKSFKPNLGVDFRRHTKKSDRR